MGGRRDRFSSRVTDDENGLSQFQLLYHVDSPLVLFFWTGGLCAACRNGLRILGDESCFGSFGRDTLWSVNLPSEGPDGIEFGSVKTSVITAKTAIVPSRTAILRGGTAGIGRPNKVCCFGIMEDRKDNR